MKRIFILSILATFSGAFIFSTIVFDTFNRVPKKEYDSIKHQKNDYQSQAESLSAENESIIAENESLLSENESIIAENESLLNQLQEEKSKMTEIHTSEADITNTETEAAKVSDLFKIVYLPYAKREKPFIYNAVKTFAESSKSKYKVEIHDPTADDAGTIKFTDDNNDYVYFAFSPVNGVDLIMIVSYYQYSTNSEVALGNYSSDGSPQYDQFTTHKIGENQIHVNSPEEQQKFLFNDDE